MIMSCSFASTASAASANAAPTDVSVSEIPQIIAGLVKIGIEVAKKAYEYYDKYVPDSVKDFNSTVAKDAAGAVKNLAKSNRSRFDRRQGVRCEHPVGTHHGACKDGDG